MSTASRAAVCAAATGGHVGHDGGPRAALRMGAADLDLGDHPKPASCGQLKTGQLRGRSGR